NFTSRYWCCFQRRPTVIQLQPCEEVYAEFLHKGNEKFTDFERVKQEIIDETLKDPGPVGFSSKPIILKIYAPNVLKLTFVDMPGIIKNATPDMTEQSIDDVEMMILRYIEQPNSIILAVSPANQDIATSDGIKMASKVDPNSMFKFSINKLQLFSVERTICVLTKLDLMDRGTDARDILENRVLPIAKGYIGVINRSQEDINEGRDIEHSLRYEKRFFENHPAYSDIAYKMGSVYLQRRLHMELVEHIRKTLPTVRKEIAQKLSSLRKDLKIMDNMMGFNNNVQSGAEVFMHKLVHKFIEDIRPTKLTEEQLINLIANVHGTRNILSIPCVSLEAACGAILKLYRRPLENFVDSITDILISAVEDSSSIKVIRFINESIDKASEETKDLLGKHLESQMNCCNVYHWDLKGSIWKEGLTCSPVKIWNSGETEENSSEENLLSLEENSEDSVAEVLNSTFNDSTDFHSFSQSISMKMRENNNAKENSKNLASILKDYIRLVQKQVADTTIKYINCFLVNHVFEFIKIELIIKLSHSSNKVLYWRNVNWSFNEEMKC
ncbi:dynamin-2, partial [Caerostris extrusa]